MLPVRYKANVRKANERKFGPLMPGRCGSCYKCCQEYLVRAALGLEPVSAARVRHCIDVFRKAYPMIYGTHLQVPGDRKLVETYLDGKRIALGTILSAV